jgi:hypothetical protein
MNGPMIVLSSPYRGGFGLERTHRRPAETGEVWPPSSPARAGRKEGAGAPRRFGGVAEAGSCAPTPQASEGGRQ